VKGTDLPTEQHALVAAQIDVHKDQPRAEVLASFGISEPEWEAMAARFTARLVDEIRERSGSSAPIEERYPLTTAYAKAYATAVREAKRDDEHLDEATVRIAPGASRDEPFSVLGASNLAAASGRKASEG
jgi:hypothetical protein